MSPLIYNTERPPSGISFLLLTWSGRLILINTLVYILMGLQGGWISPSSELLLKFGAKDVVSLAGGEFWRFFTPIFVHIGILHFAVNNIGLYFIGYPLERLLGWKWYLGVYLLAGICGNISSALFSVSMSAGASGALFGLLGCGFYLERIIGQKVAESTGTKPRTGVYSSMVVINIIFGVLVPGIDNAAHMGGLVAGTIFTYIMTLARPNQLREPNPKLARKAILVFSAVIALGIWLATSPSFVLKRLSSQAQAAIAKFEAGESPIQNGARAYVFYTEALKMDPDNLEFLFQRGRLLYLSGEVNQAIQELRLPAADASYRQRIITLAKQFNGMGMDTWQLERMLNHTEPKRN